MLRVCNLCLDQITKVDEGDDDDRHSIASAATSSFPAHQFGSDMSLGYGPGARRQAPASPFAASQLFGRGDEPFSLFSIAEARRALSHASDDSAFDSRPQTPDEDSVGVPVRAAPFRRPMGVDDEKIGVHVVEPEHAPPDGTGAGGASLSRSPVEFPKTIAVNTEGLSSIQFPVSSPDQPFAADGPFTGIRSRYNSVAELTDGPTPFIRSRVQSRLMDSLGMGEAGWRTRRESTA
jgi:1-phosphatidylinositol-3-phosphate 5-kinase